MFKKLKFRFQRDMISLHSTATTIEAEQIAELIET